MSDPFIRRRQVEKETGLSCSTIYRLMDEGRFPRPIRIGANAVAWRQSTIEQWKTEREQAVA